MAVLQFKQIGVDDKQKAIYNLDELQQFVPGGISVEEFVRYPSFQHVGDFLKAFLVEFKAIDSYGRQYRFNLDSWFILGVKTIFVWLAMTCFSATTTRSAENPAQIFSMTRLLRWRKD